MGVLSKRCDAIPPHFYEWEKQLKRLKMSSSKDDVINFLPNTRTLLDRHTVKEKSSDIEAKHRKMDEMRGMLARFRRSEQQKKLHETMLRCIAPQVYGDSIYEHELEILEYNNFTSLNKETAISAPRRFGKSWAVAMFCCVVLLCMPKCEISIFSSNARASGSEVGMSGIIRKFLIEEFQVPSERFCKDNQEHIFLKFAENDIRKLNAYPGSVHTYVLFALSCDTNPPRCDRQQQRRSKFDSGRENY